ncbi:hypothetical protein DI09_175p40 [Mitosporidium daphniae]|uniref:Uncharacterized protein n=1 Tax=Mitosporidium daphniae TaxID=1485682 RepID=A0A098VTL8_9MICR|nr:uncharacterized protein DI09_175p40 [Mitosporidium daphniae]KGG52423.1 hypothetical protein DI09_175p40 [Mitosporidium daphniae]|eukprot:XP_013238859.1 uncharacterized protein DI09_175p40 [Mitosporidium daphniae]
MDHPLAVLNCPCENPLTAQIVEQQRRKFQQVANDVKAGTIKLATWHMSEHAVNPGKAHPQSFQETRERLIRQLTRLFLDVNVLSNEIQKAFSDEIQKAFSDVFEKFEAF